MNFYKDPQGIEKRSMEIISKYLTEYNLSEEEVKVYSRVIHASGDPEYAPIIKISEGALTAAKQALSAGCNIYTDVEMVLTGINKRRLAELGGQAKCLIADEGVAKMAKELQITRSMAAMRTFGRELDGAIVAIGNAPTALFEVLNTIDEIGIKPAMIVGVPVGFVGAAESKEHLVKTAPVPYITVQGNKGGSPIAASIVNAIMYMMK